MHNVYSQPFAQACNLNGHHFMHQPHTQITATPHHQPHFQHLAQQVRKMSFDVEVNELMLGGCFFLNRVRTACTWKELTTSPRFLTPHKWRRSPRPSPSSFRLKVGLIRWSFCIGQLDESRQPAEISLDSIGRQHTRLLIHMPDFKRRFHTKHRCHCRQLRLIREFC